MTHRGNITVLVNNYVDRMDIQTWTGLIEKGHIERNTNYCKFIDVSVTSVSIISDGND